MPDWNEGTVYKYNNYSLKPLTILHLEVNTVELCVGNRCWKPGPSSCWTPGIDIGWFSSNQIKTRLSYNSSPGHGSSKSLHEIFISYLPSIFLQNKTTDQNIIHKLKGAMAFSSRPTPWSQILRVWGSTLLQHGEVFRFFSSPHQFSPPPPLCTDSLLSILDPAQAGQGFVPEYGNFFIFISDLVLWRVKGI